MADPGEGVEGSSEESLPPRSSAGGPMSPAEGTPDRRWGGRTSGDAFGRPGPPSRMALALVVAAVVLPVALAILPLPPWLPLAALFLLLGCAAVLSLAGRRRLAEPSPPHEPSPREPPPPGNERPPLDRVQVDVPGGRKVVEMADVLWIEASRNYVRLHVEGRSHLYRRSLAELEGELEALDFLRVHRSAMVNLGAVERLDPLPSGDGVLHLRSGATVRMSRRYAREFHVRTGREL